jgi:hypothetical protein
MSQVIPTPAPLPPKQATQHPPAAPKPGATPLWLSDQLPQLQRDSSRREKPQGAESSLPPPPSSERSEDR